MGDTFYCTSSLAGIYLGKLSDAKRSSSGLTGATTSLQAYHIDTQINVPLLHSALLAASHSQPAEKIKPEEEYLAFKTLFNSIPTI